MKRPFRSSVLCRGAARGVLLAGLAAAPAQAELRGLVVGIDTYQGVPPLRGAVADANDIAAVLRGRGARDVMILTNATATPKAIEGALDTLAKRARPDDTVMLSFAGIGGTLGGTAGGSAFLLAGYRPGAPSADVLPWASVLAAAARIEKAGAQVIVVNDYASGRDQVRATDDRAAGGSWGRVGGLHAVEGGGAAGVPVAAGVVGIELVEDAHA